MTVPPMLRRHLPAEYVTSTEPFVEPEPTAPFSIGPTCPDCQRGKHKWRRSGLEQVNDRVWLKRYQCGCDHCGRCAAGRLRIVVEYKD